MAFNVLLMFLWGFAWVCMGYSTPFIIPQDLISIEEVVNLWMCIEKAYDPYYGRSACTGEYSLHIWERIHVSSKPWESKDQYPACDRPILLLLYMLGWHVKVVSKGQKGWAINIFRVIKLQEMHGWTCTSLVSLWWGSFSSPTSPLLLPHPFF